MDSKTLVENKRPEGPCSASVEGGHLMAAVSSMLRRGLQAARWTVGTEKNEEKSPEGGEGSRRYQVGESPRDGPGRELVPRK